MSWKFLNDRSNDEVLKLEKFHDTVTKAKENENYSNSRMKLYPELYKSDVSIYPSYTGLNSLPYYIVCRRRLHKRKKQMARQFNREILHMAMMQSYAIAGVRIDRNFSVGFPPKALNVPDFATNDERRRINRIMSNR